MPEGSFELATTKDDPELRALLRENPIPGRISISFEREPDYFIASKVEAPFTQTIIARDLDTNRIAGMGSRAIRKMFRNGKSENIGYLSQYRVDKNYRFMFKGMRQAFLFTQKLHGDGKTPFYIASIVSENNRAKRLFQAGLPGFPKFLSLGSTKTIAIFC